ncbi:hypothetical protein [Leptotrichia trevisanii]
MKLSKVTLNKNDSYERAIERLEVVKKYSQEEVNKCYKNNLY